ncbi:MAG: hypothetical protein ACFFDT_26035 [Candidatus Hodarchaeota archaeon]
MNENFENLEEKSNMNTEKPDTQQQTKLQILGKYMVETLREMYKSLRYPEFKFAISGIATTVVLILVGLSFFIVPFLLDNGNGFQLASFRIPPNLIGVVVSIVIACVVIYLWFLLGLKVTPKAAHYLVDNKILKLVFTRGNVHYLEYIPLEKRKIAMSHILNKFIALLIAWVSVSAFLINLVAALIAEGNPIGIINPAGSDIEIIAFIIRSIIIFILVPIVFTLIYPLGWMLVDAKLKAFHSGSKLNWLVGQRVVNLTAGIITLGSLLALGADIIRDFTTRLQLMIDLVLFCIVNISLVVIIISLFYNVFFQGKFYQMITDSIEVGFGITSVTLTDEFGKALPEPESELEVETKPEPEFVPELEPEDKSEPESEFESEQTFESEEE